MLEKRLTDPERAGVAVAVLVVTTAHASVAASGLAARAVRAVVVHEIVVAAAAVRAHALRAGVAFNIGTERGGSFVVVRAKARGLPSVAFLEASEGVPPAALEELRVVATLKARASPSGDARGALEAL